MLIISGGMKYPPNKKANHLLDYQKWCEENNSDNSKKLSVEKFTKSQSLPRTTFNGWKDNQKVIDRANEIKKELESNNTEQKKELESDIKKCLLIIMLRISGANNRTFKLLKRVANYYADNQRLLITRCFIVNHLQSLPADYYADNQRLLMTRCFIVNHLQSLPADYYADNQRPKPANYQTVETSR